MVCIKDLIYAIGFSLFFISLQAKSETGLECLPRSAVDCSTSILSALLPPVGIYDEVFKEACVKHDFCYRYGKKTYDLSRSTCDSIFYTDMRKICNDVNFLDIVTLGGNVAACHSAAVAYFGAVRAFGREPYKNKTSSYCPYSGPEKSRICSINTPHNSECWTEIFSEENDGAMRCPSGKAIAGVWCTGSYCDNKNLFCKPFPMGDSVENTKWISEEEPNTYFRVDNRNYSAVLTGLSCKGAYCDKISGEVKKIINAQKTGVEEWSKWVSEEQGIRLCGDDQFVTGFGCKGSYCDKLSLQCSTFRISGDVLNSYTYRSCNEVLNSSETCWSDKFSEEGVGEATCPRGKAVAGLWCDGSYCDNKKLLCKNFGITRSLPDTKWVSEEKPNTSFRVDKDSITSVVTGLKCKGSYCDNLSAKVGSARIEENINNSGNWKWLKWSSEEHGVTECDANEFVTGIDCKGSYCDNISLRCSYFRTSDNLERKSKLGY